MIFEFIPIDKTLKTVIQEFDCGTDTYNSFLKENALDWMANGYATTYVAVDSDENADGNISKIYGYASINATGLLGKNLDKKKYLSCAEIRLFAVAKALRGDEAVDIDGVRYSYKVFQALMQELFYIATSTIGFCAVTLNSNDDGLDLYTKFGFVHSEDYLLPEDEEKIDIEDCTPLVFSFLGEDALYKLFE
ncbi:hypothetical protein SAMN04487770_12228 [Butyrivibrio sp. ob235]|uniref:hypothetical protein n=1 Tax=Butyrivibrio sp. ob235 TaxID=1761780 RepID=UPI0008C2E3F2|nr:hypothetical protein [Butyrivibrio sp. ob235]SEL96992.1 hypothetical protein SAMN04487770_12228 [Butyrivibrio sp. ob235]